MLIRKEQLTALSCCTRASFEQRMAAHLLTYFARTCRAWERAALSEFITRQTDRALEYGFATERQAADYIDCMFSLRRAKEQAELDDLAAVVTAESADPGERLEKFRQLARDGSARLSGGAEPLI